MRKAGAAEEDLAPHEAREVRYAGGESAADDSDEDDSDEDGEE